MRQGLLRSIAAHAGSGGETPPSHRPDARAREVSARSVVGKDGLPRLGDLLWDGCHGRTRSSISRSAAPVQTGRSRTVAPRPRVETASVRSCEGRTKVVLTP